MRILFLHGWNSVPGGVKPTYLKDHGHEVINPKLTDKDFNLVRTSGQPASALIEVGDDHRLADPEPLRKILEASWAIR